MNEFKLGQEVSTLYFINNDTISISQHDVDKITVVMEYGQMAGVPWFAVWKDGKIKTKWNGAQVEGVEL